MNSLPPRAAPQQILARIVSTELVAPRHFLFTLQAPAIASAARAGQFVHILPHEVQGFDPLLRRAFSILAADAVSGEIQILFRAGGSGTTQLSGKGVGDSLDVLGPLGQPFDLNLFHVKQAQNRIPILVGGGVGVPPLVFLGETLKTAGLEPTMLLGARTAAETLGLPQLERLEVETRVATDDGSAGQRGRVTDLLEVALQNAAQSKSQSVVYACGPLPMLRAVAALCARFGAPCQVSMEENMPCGIGVCNGCVVATKLSGSDEGEATDYGRYQRVCVAGPALWADVIDWEAV